MSDLNKPTLWDRITGRASLLERVNALERAIGESKPRIPEIIASGNADRDRMNSWPRSGRVDAALLRQVADHTAIVRAAINAKKRHVSALHPVVRGPDDATVLALQGLVDKPTPDHTWRQWVSEVLEDVLVLDAACLYVWPRRNGALYALLPVDAATIAITPDARGLLPQPPATAYEQRVNGAVTATFTVTEMLYEQMNPRAHSLYGLSPTEVVLHTALTALRRMAYSADLLDGSNVPAFFGEVPDNWNTAQIREFQEYWDQMTTNRPHRGVWGPNGTNVRFPPQTEVRTEFDVYLAQLVCAVFEIQPQELGFTGDVNRATGEVQEEITQRRSVRPLAELISEVWQQAFALTGYGEYRLAWPELEERTNTEIRLDAQVLVPLGVLTPNEVRAELYLDPLPGGDEPRRPGLLGFAAQPEMTRVSSRIPLQVPAPDDQVVLLQLQETLQRGYLEASQRLAVEALLDTLREASERGEPITAAMINEAAAAVSNAHGEAIRPVVIRSLQQMAEVGVEAGAEAFTAAVNIGLDWTLANTDAANWARQYGGKLIKGLDDTTKARVGAEVGAWAEARENYRDLVKRIRTVVDDQRRAELIAQTEPTNAYAAGNMAAWKEAENELGLSIVKVWNTANDDWTCAICRPLNQQERPLDELFDGGIERPAAHPRCRCWLTSEVILNRAALARFPWLRERVAEVGH